jgi:AbrB family looped-hinge helix DNA binding protein
MKISDRGQITLPKKIRTRYGLKPNTEVEIVEMDRQLILRKKPSRELPLQAVRGVLLGHATAKSTDQILENLRGR